MTRPLIGQADPIGRADAARYLQSDAGALDLAKRIESGLLLVAPDANLPKLPEHRGKRARAALPAAGEDDRSDRDATEGATGGGSESGSRRPLLAVLCLLAVLLIGAVLALSGAFSKDDGSSSSGGTETTASTDPADQTRNVTTVDLKPTDGSGVAGTAKFGIANQQQLYVDVVLDGLPQPKQGDTYLVWLMVGSSGGYPINNPAQTPITPDENGSFSGSIAVPSAIALTVGDQATSVKVSSSSVKEVADAAKKAAQAQAPILGFIGTELASGDIPLVNDKQSEGDG